VSVQVYVDAYSGYKSNERPRQFVLDEAIYEIVAVEEQWYSPEAMFFRVRTDDHKRYILRYDEREDEWTLQSGFDGAALMVRSDIELIPVDAGVIREAEKRIESCEQCRPDEAEVQFDWILAEVTGKHGMYDFVLTEIARCPNCKRSINEKMLVEVKG
jgi:hypothetical protein